MTPLSSKVPTYRTLPQENIPKLPGFSTSVHLRIRHLFYLKVFLLISSDDGVPDGVGLRVLRLDGDDLRELGRTLDDRRLVQELVEHRAAQIRSGCDANL